MPGSSYKGKMIILEWRRGLPKMKKVLDIGPGWGTYINLLRKPGEFWEALEIFEPYVQKFKLNKLYDKVTVGNAIHYSPDGSYDFVIMGDVLEHMEKSDAKKVLKNVFSYSNYSLVSIPLDDETDAGTYNFDDYWNNPYEKHLAKWSNTEFISLVADLGAEVIALNKYYESGVYLICSGAKQNYLQDTSNIFDKVKHLKFTVDSGRSLKGKIKYNILRFTPKSVHKVIKKFKNEKV